MGKEQSVCQQKWKYLKGRFIRAWKKVKERSGVAGGKVCVSLDISPLELAVRLCERILINYTRVQHVLQVYSRKWY